MTIQNRHYVQGIQNLAETANNVNEVLGAGGGFGQQQPSTLSTAPRTPFDFAQRGPANQTRGLYSGCGSCIGEVL